MKCCMISLKHLILRVKLGVLEDRWESPKANVLLVPKKCSGISMIVSIIDSIRNMSGKIKTCIRVCLK